MTDAEAETIDKALKVAARSVDRNPSDAAKEAGNYAKGHVNYRGLDIAIESPKGSYRSGKDGNGKPWRCMLPAHYGYMKGSEGNDGDHVDVYLGPDSKSDKVWIVDQIDLSSKKFDEHKCLLGFSSKADATACYRNAFSDGKGMARMGGVSELSFAAFKEWIKGGKTKEPLALPASGRTDARKGYADGGRVFDPRYLILHDYGGTPKGDQPFNPYHTLVMPDGRVIYRTPDNPYGAPAPHAYRLNSQALGLSYGAPVGSTPTPEGLAALRGEYEKIKGQFPNIQPLGHGEAFSMRDSIPRASRNGRDMIEASWRTYLGNDTPLAEGSPPTVASPASPMASRSLVAHAGLTPPAVPPPAPTPTVAPAAPPIPPKIPDGVPAPAVTSSSPSSSGPSVGSLIASIMGNLGGGDKAPTPIQAPPIRANPAAMQRMAAAALPYETDSGDTEDPSASNVPGNDDEKDTALMAYGGVAKPKKPGFGGIHAGPLRSKVPGRTDKLPINVKSGSFVVPADVVSGLGQGNSEAGHDILSSMPRGKPYGVKSGPYGVPLPKGGGGLRKPPQAANKKPTFPLPAAGRTPKIKFADGGIVPILAAGGEHVYSPEEVAQIGSGDLDRGHAVLDAFVRKTRARIIKDMSALPPPAR